jgi:beta-lactamase class A
MKNTQSNQRFLNKKSLLLLFFLAILLITNYITFHYNQSNSDVSHDELNSELSNVNYSYKIKRLPGHNYINPILFVDNKYESDALIPIKQSIINLIENYKRIGVINSASFYMIEFNENNWTGINTEEKYMPGSLMKIPILITFLKMEELNPGFLNKEILYNQKITVLNQPKYISKTIHIGEKYTLRELLNYMIAYSDNNATNLLYSKLDVIQFKKIFTELGMIAPEITDINYQITSKDVSYFMRVLYNASYLNDKNSLYAITLLRKCNFNEGILSSIPSTVNVAHKFGEAGNLSEEQFSETALIYLENNPYVLTIMTNGKDYKQLPKVIKDISGIVYQYMSNSNKIQSM